MGTIVAAASKCVPPASDSLVLCLASPTEREMADRLVRKAGVVVLVALSASASAFLIHVNLNLRGRDLLQGFEFMFMAAVGFLFGGAAVLYRNARARRFPSCS